MRLRPVLVVLAVLAVTAGCSDEEPPPIDDGSQGLPLAGLGPQIEDAGVEVVSAAAPASASGAEVAAALDGAEATSPSRVDQGYVAFDPTATAGLVSVVGPADGEPVVLVFGDPAAAAVFAAGDPDVLAGDAAEPDVLLAGNLVGYAAQEADAVREALAGLAGTTTATPSDSPS